MKEILEVLAELEFIDTDECYECRDFLREKYALLTRDERKIYKWYFFYQLCILKYPLKNALWCYICGEDNQDKLEEEYSKFCEHRESIKRKM